MAQTFERYLTEADERRLLAEAGRYGDVYSRRDRLWMQLLRHTGIRVGSLSGLTVADATEALRSGYLDVRADIAKGGRGYRVHVNKKALAALKGLLALRREMGHAALPEGALVMGRKHAGLSVRQFQERMALWVKRAGLPVAATPHWWRHTLAKRVIARSTANNPLPIVQAALGHRNLGSTGIYVRPDREEVAQALEEAG